MRIYFLASQVNLEAFKKHLTAKFKNVQIFGSNDFDEAVQEVLRRAPVNPYDAVIFTRYVDIARDVSARGVSSQNLLDALKLSLSGKQVIFLVPSSRKEIFQPISEFFKVSNARLIKYDGKFSMSIIEQAMRDAVLLHDSSVEDTSILQESLHQTMKSSIGDNGYLRHASSLGVNATDKIEILTKYLKRPDTDFETLSVEDITSTLSKIKDKIISNTKDMSENITSSVEDIGKITNNVKPLVEVTNIEEIISEEEIKETLYASDKDYQSLAEVKNAMDLAVVELKDTKANPEMTISLMQDRIEVVNKMKVIEVGYLSKVSEELSNVTVAKFTTASGLVKFKMQDLAELSSNTDIRHIELLKEARDNFVKRVTASSSSFSETIDTLRDIIQTSGRNYVAMVGELEKEMLEYANKTELSLPAKPYKDSTILEVLQKSYSDTATTFVDIGNKANDLISGFQTVLKIDEEIINKQTKVISELATGNVRRVVSVGGILESKSTVIVGKEGNGKTAIATSIAHAMSKKGLKVLVFDLDSYTPSLQFYGKEELVGYDFTMSEGNLDFKFESGNRLSFVMNPLLVPNGKKIEVSQLLEHLKNNENLFDRVIFIIEEDDSNLAVVQAKCKSTVYVSTGDVSSMGKAFTLADSLLNVTPINTVVVNKCSQQMIELVKTKLPLQIRNIAVIPCLHFNKFDYYKAHNIIPSRESTNFETTGFDIMTSID